MKVSKKLLAAAGTAAVVAVVLLGVFVFNWFGTPVKDCGSNYMCYLNAVAECSPAKFAATSAAGTPYEFTSSAEVKGRTGGNCAVYSKLTDANGSLDMTCQVPMDLINKVFASATTSQYDLSQYCTGPLADKLKNK